MSDKKTSFISISTQLNIPLVFFSGQVLRRSLEVSVLRSSRGSAGEESDEEWVEEQIEREESTESLEELGLPPSSSNKTSTDMSHPRVTGPKGCLRDPAELMVLDFGPSPKGTPTTWITISCMDYDIQDILYPVYPVMLFSQGCILTINYSGYLSLSPPSFALI